MYSNEIVCLLFALRLSIAHIFCYSFQFNDGGFIGPLAAIDYEPRQARKGAAVIINSGAEVWLLKLPPNFVNVPMSYLALARKWRPRIFSQLVGQDHINKTLINSLNQQRLHHAYLFTGTRGVGKTSVARLMAKALNCEQGISAEPCLQCETCIAIEQGRFIDLIEIDGASKTRIEDTRELLDNVQYAATSGRFKIYLIDEVHMLSQHSFNALLKTLEEPPAHVKFLLATTEPQKLPITVLSRCLQFNLKHLSVEIINQHLHYIINEEKQTAEPEALIILAKAAHGSMRDALSLLDQVIATAAGEMLSVSQVKSALGYSQQDYALHLLQALIAMKAEQIISISRQIACEGGQFNYVMDELITYLHQITLYQQLPNEHPLLLTTAEIKMLADQLSPEDTQLFYQIALKGAQEMHLAPILAIGFEMTLLRMLTFRPASLSSTPELAYESSTAHPKEIIPPSPVINTPSNEESPVVNTISPQKGNERPASPIKKALTSSSAVSEQINTHDESWETIVAQLKLSGMAQNALENAELVNKTTYEITLRVDKGHQSLFTPLVTKRIEQALSQYYKQTLKLSLCIDAPVQSSPALKKQNDHSLKQQSAEADIHNDPVLKQLKQEFSAEIIKNSIVPIEDPL